MSAFFTTGSRGDSIPPVMIRFTQPDAKASAALEEDLFVMSRVISRTLERADGEKVSYKLGVPMLLTGSGRSVRPMYIEGLGPLFMIKVPFALTPPAKEEEKTAHAPAPDSEWNAAQRDVFGAPEAVYDGASAHNSSYNEEQVDMLKKELISALKNAANIRGLKPDEFVTISVFGLPTGARVKSYKIPGAGATAALSMALTSFDADSANAGKGSVMTLRAKKADIDGFASGKLSAEEFKGKVLITAYAGSGSGVTSINSWIQESEGRVRTR